MSTLDQPLLIANSNYHVGHQVAIFVAEEQGFFREEGLKEYEYDARGLIPGPLERDGLAMAITNHGVDIATAVDVEAAIYQRSLGADIYIVGGWRYTPFLRWYGAKHLTRHEQAARRAHRHARERGAGSSLHYRCSPRRGRRSGKRSPVDLRSGLRLPQ